MKRIERENDNKKRKRYNQRPDPFYIKYVTIKGWKDVEKILSSKEMEILKDILEQRSHPKNRYDKLKKLSFEIAQE